MPVLSVEEVGIFKPHPSVYQLVVDRLGVPAAKVSFQSSNAWDANGAAAFGFRVAWCNRFGQGRNGFQRRPTPRSRLSRSFLRCWASPEDRDMRLLQALGLIAFLAAGAAASVAQADSWLTGRVLVASEHMSDPRFQETVIYLVDHDENGAFGLVVNKPISTGPIEGLLDRLGIDLDDEDLGALRGGSITLHYGGPVQPEIGFLLHSASTRSAEPGSSPAHLRLPPISRR